MQKSDLDSSRAFTGTYKDLVLIDETTPLEEIFPPTTPAKINALDFVKAFVSPPRPTMPIESTLDQWMIALILDYNRAVADSQRFCDLSQLAARVLKQKNTIILQELLEKSEQASPRVVELISVIDDTLLTLKALKKTRIFSKQMPFNGLQLVPFAAFQLPPDQPNCSKVDEKKREYANQHLENRIRRLSADLGETSIEKVRSLFKTLTDPNQKCHALASMDCHQQLSILFSIEDPDALVSLMNTLPRDAFIVLLKTMEKRDALYFNFKIKSASLSLKSQFIEKMHEVLLKLTKICNRRSQNLVDDAARNLREMNHYLNICYYVKIIDNVSHELHFDEVAVLRVAELTGGIGIKLRDESLLTALKVAYQNFNDRCSIEDMRSDNLYRIVRELSCERNENNEVTDEDPIEEVFFQLWNIAYPQQLVHTGLIKEGEDWDEIKLALRRLGLNKPSDFKTLQIHNLESLGFLINKGKNR